MNPYRSKSAVSRRLACTVALGLLLAAPAHATTYYVSTSGNDASPGTQGSPWRTISKANAVLRPGDVCQIQPGTYTDPIRPATNGTSSGRITYVGSLVNPASVTAGPIQIDKAWITVKGVRSTGACELYYTSETAKAWHDSVAWCVVTAGGASFQGAKNCMVARSTINGSIAFLMNNFQAGPPGFVDAESDTLRGNLINLGTITLKGFQMRGFTQMCLVDSNRISGFFAVANGGDLQGRYIYNSYNNTFRDNSWTLESDGALPGGAQYTGFALRDSSSNNLFERDSMLCGVQSGVDIGGRLVNSGNSAWTGQCRNNRWKGCFFKTTGYTFNQDVLRDAIIENTVFASKNTYGLYLLGPVQNTIIRNCTFYSASSPPVKVEGDVRLGGNQIYSNIFLTETVGACFSGRPILFHGWATGFTQDYNLFYSKTAAAGVTAKNQAVYWSSSYCSAPGVGTQWANSTGNDTHSAYGAPMFVNDTFANFDPHLQTASAARGIGMGGSDAGAYPFGGGADLTPPGAVSNLAPLQVYDTSAQLQWSAPGDDGSTGLASAYDMRWSASPITDQNFASATPVATQPAPQPAGALQSYVMLSLAPNATYYFAIKARDEANNWSALSNVLAVTTRSADQASPASVKDLSAGP